MKLQTSMIGLALMAMGALGAVSHGGNQTPQAGKGLLRVGVYDSRAITIAYSASKHNDPIMVQKSKEKKQAEQAGDAAQAEMIDRWMAYFSIKRHSQGFSTAPVHDLLKPIQEKIPQLARDAGVDVIVSKWEFDYLAANVEVVDVTERLVQLYDPTPKALVSIKQISNMQPMSEEEIVRHELKGGH